MSDKIADFVQFLGSVASGMEAASFRLNDESGELEPTAHIRPGEPDEQVKASAIRAFVNLATPYVRENRDGVIEVQNSAKPDGTSQFCLVHLVRNQDALVAVITVIVRCRDLKQAERRLEKVKRLTMRN